MNSVVTGQAIGITPLQFVKTVLTHEDGTPLGQRLDEWQLEDFAAALTTDKHQWWERPRGYDKSRGAAAVALAKLTLGDPGQRIYLAATDAEQAALAFDSLRGFIRRTSLLSQTFRVLRREVVFEEQDSIVTVLSADAASSWGLRPSLLVVDELSQWRTPAHEEFFWSLWSSLGKVAGAKMLVATTAHWDRAGLAWKVREQVKDDPDWHFVVRHGGCASWIKPEFLEAQRRLLPRHLFQMLHENVWTEAGGEFLTWEEIDSIFDPAHAEKREPVPGSRYWFGLDIGTSRDRTSLAVVRMDGKTVVVDALAVWAGSSQRRVQLTEVKDVIVQLARRFRPVDITVDPTQALLLVDELRDVGIQITEYPFSTPSRAALFDLLLQLVRERRLKCFLHAGLREELSGLRWTEKGGLLRPDHSSTSHDDITISILLALQKGIHHRRIAVV